LAKKHKPRKQAIAIKGMERDEVSASIAARGTGKLAEKIIAIAKEHGIPVKEDPDIVGLLAKLDLEQALPPELYPLIAELLGFAYRLNKAAAQDEKTRKEESVKQEAAPGAAGFAERRVTVEAGEGVPDKLPQPKALPNKRAVER